MGLERNVGGRDRELRAALAVLATVVAVAAFRKGKRSRALSCARRRRARDEERNRE